jgi:WD40-like Beta Propeller Repeat
MDGERHTSQPPGVVLARVGGQGRPRRGTVALALAVTGAIVGAALVGSAGLRLYGYRPAAQPTRIAVVEANGALRTLDPDGTDRRVHSVESLEFQFPAWSPDGSHLAAIGHDRAGAGVFVFDDRTATDVGDADPQPVAAYRSPLAAPIYLYWSPDGRRIAFLTGEPDGLSLQVAAADGSAPAAVVRRGQPLYWDWIDASHVFVHSGANAPGAFLGEVAVDTSDVLSIDAAVGAFQAPAMSLDGRSRAYVAGEGPSTTVVIEARDGSFRHEAKVSAGSALGWSPAGDQLAYSNSPVGAGLPVGPLELIDVRSGETRQLVDGPVVAWFWAPDGRTLAVLRFRVQGDGQIASAGGNPLAVTDLLTLRLLFVDVASGAIRFGREVRLSDLVLAQFLPFADQYARSHRIWSPASDAIVLPLQDETGSSHITIVPADGSPERRIAEGVAAFWSP